MIFYSYYILLLSENKKIEELLCIKNKVDAYYKQLNKKDQTPILKSGYASFINNFISCQIELLNMNNLQLVSKFYIDYLLKYATPQGVLIHYYYKVIIYFWHAEYHQALKSINYILNHHNLIGVRKDVFFFLKIMFLIIHFELKNYELLINYSKMFYNDYVAEKRDSIIERLLLDLFIKNDFYKQNKLEHSKLFLKLHQRIINDKIFEPKIYFHLTDWILSKSQNRLFNDVVREKYENKLK